MNRQFVALSGLAILIVVLNHSIVWVSRGIAELGLPQATGWEGLSLALLRGLGAFAVPTFLFTSGSFVSYAAQRTPPRLPWKTVWAALKRLWWPYLFWSIVAYVYFYVRQVEVYTLGGYIKNLIVGRPFHFVPILLFYYACSPLLVRLTPRFGYVVLVGIALYQAFLIPLVSPATFGLTLPGWTEVLVPPVLGETMAIWGVFFPLGLIYSLKAKEMSPWLQKLRLVFAFATLVFFVLLILNDMGFVWFPFARYLCPLAFLFLAPTIKRNSIPAVRQFEKIAKRSYGLYLTHLVLLDLLVFTVQVVAPGLMAYQLLVTLVLYGVALAALLTLMNGVVRSPVRVAYHYLFG